MAKKRSYTKTIIEKKVIDKITKDLEKYFDQNRNQKFSNAFVNQTAVDGIVKTGLGEIKISSLKTLLKYDQNFAKAYLKATFLNDENFRILINSQQDLIITKALVDKRSFDLNLWYNTAKINFYNHKEKTSYVKIGNKTVERYWDGAELRFKSDRKNADFNTSELLDQIKPSDQLKMLKKQSTMVDKMTRIQEERQIVMLKSYVGVYLKEILFSGPNDLTVTKASGDDLISDFEKSWYEHDEYEYYSDANKLIDYLILQINNNPLLNLVPDRVKNNIIQMLKDFVTNLKILTGTQKPDLTKIGDKTKLDALDAACGNNPIRRSVLNHLLDDNEINTVFFTGENEKKDQMVWTPIRGKYKTKPKPEKVKKPPQKRGRKLGQKDQVKRKRRIDAPLVNPPAIIPEPQPLPIPTRVVKEVVPRKQFGLRYRFVKFVNTAKQNLIKVGETIKSKVKSWFKRKKKKH